MSQDSNWDIDDRVDGVFKNIVIPVYEGLINDYDAVGGRNQEFVLAAALDIEGINDVVVLSGGTDGDDGYEVKIVSDGPIIIGIEKYSSIKVKHPGGLEMIVCVYWVKNSERLIAENILLITHNKSFDLFSVTKEDLASQIKFLSGLKA